MLLLLLLLLLTTAVTTARTATATRTSTTATTSIYYCLCSCCCCRCSVAVASTVLDQSYHCETDSRFIVTVLASAASSLTSAAGVARSSFVVISFPTGIITATTITTRMTVRSCRRNTGQTSILRSSCLIPMVMRMRSLVRIVTLFHLSVIQTGWPPFSPSEAVPLSPAALHSGHSRPCAGPLLQALGCRAWEFGLSVQGSHSSWMYAFGFEA